jgi:hypothetical protein
MFTTPLNLPATISQFFSVSSPLNPHFFAYGNFPLYLLKIAGEIASIINPMYKIYGGIHIVGRLISAVFDTGTVFIVFLIASAIFSKRAGLFGSLLYALSVFPIQAAHFYAVDSMLTFFTSFTIFMLILFIQKPSVLKSILVGILFGFSLAIKVSAAIIFIDILLALYLVLFRKKKHEYIKTLIYIFSTFVISIFIFIITQPYVVIDFYNFLKQTQLQSQMSGNAYLFPYTLQYVGKIPYLYELKNIFLWGEGPIIFSLNLLGLIFLIKITINKKTKNKKIIIFLIFSFLSYFLVFGKFAVGWMRYMLPLYPFLSVYGGYYLSEVIIPKIPKRYLSNYLWKKSILLSFILVILIYPVSFLSIYLYPNTRIQASEWINKNISPGSRVAVEHWDDALPVYGGEKYVQLTRPLYEPDTEEKWIGINSTLQNTDYIFIASNRLYKPLQKLTDCNHLQVGRCYPLTSTYYKNLFSGKLGFKKVAEFAEYPTVPFFNIRIIDDDADESFTVYDHPKILIFKKD